VWDNVKKPCFLFLCAALFFTARHVNARGKTEAAGEEAKNTEYTLLITAFDTSSVSAAQEAFGPILQQQLAFQLNRIHHRTRSGAELLRYGDLGWTAAMNEAAVKLAEKRAERDALVYQGLPKWKYKKETRRLDREIIALELEFAKTEVKKPLIEGEPVFLLSDPSMTVFPLPPKRGEEESFLKTNNADSFIAGTLQFLYGRIYVELRLYTRGGAFTYEDSTIFSPDAMNEAADEINRRLLIAVSGEQPAHITITTDPEDAQILVNGALMESGQRLTITPGPVEIIVSANEHLRRIENTTIKSAEEADYFFILTPFLVEELDIMPAGEKNLSVYMGAFYEGSLSANNIESMNDISGETETLGELESEMQTALRLRIPVNEYRYIRIETEDGLTGEAIVKGTVDTAEIRVLDLDLKKLSSKDEQTVEKARRKFYGAFGRFWVTLPVAFFLNGYTQTYALGYNLSGNQNLYRNTNNYYYWSIGAWIAAGTFFVESMIRLVIYVHTANKETIPLWE
jgi:hypothetical protein